MKEKLLKFYGLAKHQIVDYWNKPRENEYLNNKQLLAYTVTASGMNIYNFMNMQGFNFGFGLFCGAIMKIAQLDFTIIATISTIMTYVMLWSSPLHMLIYENHGRLEKKTKIFAHIGMLATLAIAIGLYFLPVSTFDNILVALPQIVANIMIINVFNFYTDWFVRRFFSKKYGRIKPFLVAYGLPLFIISCVIVNIPVSTPYATKLVLLHFLFGISGTMHADFSQTDPIVRFLSPNTQERQRMFSIVPIFSFAIVSLVGMLYPLLCNGRQNELIAFKIGVPVLYGIGILMAYFIVGCKENVIEDKTEKREKVKFFESAKDVFRDKYLWLYHISQLFMTFTYLTGNLANLWFVYMLRQGWVVGFVITIIAIPATLGQIITPFLSKRFNKRALLIAGRLFRILVLVGDLFAVLLSNVPLFIASNLLLSVTQCIENGISAGILPDIIDRHQWKYGVRCDSTIGVFNWFMPLLAIPISYVMPLLLKGIGFTSDWDILYSSDIGMKYFIIIIAMNIIGVILVTIPYFFYNITNKKHQRFIYDINKRVREQERIHLLQEKMERGEYVDPSELENRLNVCDDIVRFNDRRL